MTRLFQRIEPEQHIEYRRRFAAAVTRHDLDNQIQFSSIRAMDLDEDGAIKDIGRQLDLFTKHYKLGHILWIFYKFIYAPNLKEFVDEVKARGLFIFDIWGYVPGSFLDRSSWGEYEVPEEAAAYLRETLGRKFMGFDNGEQDGRYIGAYTPMICPVDSDRKAAYLHFQRHFEQLGNHFGNQTTAVCSLNFGHYFAKEGNVIMLGAETAQALINANMWYAYLRGAGKQYGLLWFGNASIWNRFGYKDFEREGTENGYEFGEDSGTSLSLLRRLLYVEYMYNCDILGLEWGFTMPDSQDATGTKLTPIGQIQSKAVEFVEKIGYPGVMHTPVAIVMDFFNGWTPPRHLYTHEYYKVWGNLPYEAGDYQTHALFTLLYPGYENSGFYRDERGFLTPTPYGDLADVLFTDADPQILARYSTIILAGEIKLDVELFEKLQAFVEGGGHLIATAQLAESAQLPESWKRQLLAWLGIKQLGELHGYARGEQVCLDGVETVEPAFELYQLQPDEEAQVAASLRESGQPLIICSLRGNGKISFIASPYGLNSEKLQACEVKERETTYLLGPDIVTEKLWTAADNRDGKDLPLYYDYLSSVKQYVGRCLQEERIVAVSNPTLQVIVNRTQDGTFLVTVANHSAAAQRFDFVQSPYAVAVREELEVPGLPEDSIGYYAKEFDWQAAEEEGTGSLSIRPADIRIFRVEVAGVPEVRETVFSGDETGCKYVALRNIGSLKKELLTSPTLRHHFQGVKLDAAYLMERESEWLEREASYIARRKLKVMLDFSSLLNHYPQLSLLDNLKDRYEENMRTIESVFAKAAYYSCEQAVFVLHRNAENHITPEEAVNKMADSLRTISEAASRYGITVYLQNGTRGRLLRSTEESIALVQRLQLPNLKFAYNLGHSIGIGEQPEAILEKFSPHISGMLLSVPGRDDYGQYYDRHAPLHDSAQAASVPGLLQAAENLDFVCLDAQYNSWNEVYLDRNYIETWMDKR